MSYREIPDGSIEIQTGLWAEPYTYKVGSVTRLRYNLYSAEGYCFYVLNVPENFDENGNLRPEHERVYATFMACTPILSLDDINKLVVSVPAK